MSDKPLSRLRHSHLRGAARVVPDGVDPATVHIPTPPRPTTGKIREQNREQAHAARERLIERLHCQDDACREVVAYLEHTPDNDPGFAVSPVRLRFQAPWLPGEKTDSSIRAHIILSGASDPAVSPTFATVARWKRGERVIVTCRHGHQSSFGGADLAWRLKER